MRLAILVCLVFSAACSGDATNPDTALTVDGRWKATLVGAFTPGGSGVATLSLTQKGTTVTGTGGFSDPTDPPASIYTVSGTVNGSSVALTLQTQPQQYMGRTVDADAAPAQFTGTLTATTMIGTLNGGGPPPVSGLAASFTRQ